MRRTCWKVLLTLVSLDVQSIFPILDILTELNAEDCLEESDSLLATSACKFLSGTLRALSAPCSTTVLMQKKDSIVIRAMRCNLLSSLLKSEHAFARSAAFQCICYVPSQKELSCNRLCEDFDYQKALRFYLQMANQSVVKDVSAAVKADACSASAHLVSNTELRYLPTLLACTLRSLLSLCSPSTVAAVAERAILRISDICAALGTAEEMSRKECSQCRNAQQSEDRPLFLEEERGNITVRKELESVRRQVLKVLSKVSMTGGKSQANAIRGLVCSLTAVLVFYILIESKMCCYKKRLCITTCSFTNYDCRTGIIFIYKFF